MIKPNFFLSQKRKKEKKNELTLQTKKKLHEDNERISIESEHQGSNCKGIPCN